MSQPERVSPAEIKLQREKGWPDFHPETYCHRCGARNIDSWFVDSDRFSAAMEALGLDGGDIVCPSCFVEGHEKATGMTTTWKLAPAIPFRRSSTEGSPDA